MKDILKVVVGLIIIVIAFKIITGILGLLIGVAIAGLVVYGGVKLLEGPRWLASPPSPTRTGSSPTSTASRART